MGRDDARKSEAPPDFLLEPQVRLIGEVNPAMVERFIDGVAAVPDDAPAITVELTTAGGDAEIGRRLALEVRLARRRKPRLVFLGKTAVESAGVTMMSAFPRDDRFLSADCVLLIHCRSLARTVEFSGPLESSLHELRALGHEVNLGMRLERDGFAQLIEGSDIGLDELRKRALDGWHLSADEALDRRLVAGLL